MNNKKGFTLMEIMVVVIIVGILAALSVPNIIGYARDARNDRAKSSLYTIAQGYKNFISEYPLTSFADQGGYGPLTSVTMATSGQTCDNSLLNNLVSGSTSITYSALIQCSYINNINYEGLRYHFYLGDGNGECSACNDIPDTALACMVGNDGGSYGENYCAYIDIDNVLHETAI